MALAAWCKAEDFDIAYWRNNKEEIPRGGYAECDDDFIDRISNLSSKLGHIDYERAWDLTNHRLREIATIINAEIRKPTGKSRAQLYPEEALMQLDPDPKNHPDVLSRDGEEYCALVEPNVKIYQVSIAHKKTTAKYVLQATAKVIEQVPEFRINPSNMSVSTKLNDAGTASRPCPNGVLTIELVKKLVMWQIEEMQRTPNLRNPLLADGEGFKIQLHPELAKILTLKASPKKRKQKDKQFAIGLIYVYEFATPQNPHHFVPIRDTLPPKDRTKKKQDLDISNANFQRFTTALATKTNEFRTDAEAPRSGYFEYHWDADKAIVDDDDTLVAFLEKAKDDGKDVFELVWKEGDIPPQAEYTKL